jgi:transposase
MAYSKHVVQLTAEERKQLEKLVNTGNNPAATIRRARILLKADGNAPGGGWDNQRIANALDTTLMTVYRVREKFVKHGLETALYRKKPTGRQYRKLDGEGEAKLIALACSAPPEGRVRWTLQLLADRMVRLKIVDTISDDTVQRTLKKTNLSLG